MSNQLQVLCSCLRICINVTAQVFAFLYQRKSTEVMGILGGDRQTA